MRQPIPVRSEAAPRARIERNADSSEITLAFEDNRLAALIFGLYDQNLAKIERIEKIYRNDVKETPEIVYQTLAQQKLRLETLHQAKGDYVSPLDL